MKYGHSMKMSNQKAFEVRGKVNACRLCGQYIQDGEDFGLIVTPMPWHKEDRNFFVHTEEWEEYTEGLEDADSIFGKLSNTPKPDPNNKTRPDLVKVEAFERVLRKRGYRIEKETTNRIYFKLSKDAAAYYFEKRFQMIVFTGRANGLFDRMAVDEIISRLQEDWYQELGMPVVEGFRVQKALEEAVTNTEVLLGYV